MTALATLRTGGKRALADALARLETDFEAPETVALLDAALAAPVGFALGLTGPPGVGKSTLIDALIRHWRAEDRTIGVIAVDPSSQLTGGALLGDRTRFSTDPGDSGVFIRSMAARDRLGGLAALTFPAMVLMRALHDIVIVETVGVGQSETAISGCTDVVTFCAQPGSGDALQFMKAGVMEIPDLVVVTKADMGVPARRALSDLRGALSLGAADRSVPVFSCSASDGTGIPELAAAMTAHGAQILPDLSEHARRQANHWLEEQFRSRFGAVGLEIIHRDRGVETGTAPFCRAAALSARLSAAMNAAFL